MTTATATTTPQINELIGWIRKNNRAARAARFFSAIFWRSLPNGDVNPLFLRFWRKPTAVNLSFIAFAWKPFVPRKRKCTSPILYNVTNLE